MSICVYGLKRTGLVTAARFANTERNVIGFDFSERVLGRLRAGRLSLGDPELEEYVADALSGDMTIRSKPVEADFHIVCAPTPYDHERERAVLTYVRHSAQEIAEKVRPGDTVVLESTVPPGTTSGMFSRTVSQSGVAPGTGFQLGYASRTFVPGNSVDDVRDSDLVVGGIDASSTQAVVDLYKQVTSSTIHEAPDPTTAEFVTLAQQAARDIEVAFANTLALIARDYGVNIRDAISLANNDPEVDIPDPVPGVGGHCLPVNPLVLGHWSEQTDFLDCARKVNESMPTHIVEQLKNTLGSLEHKRVAILGVGPKNDSRDAHGSPGLAIARQLDTAIAGGPRLADGGGRQTEVRLHDPRLRDATLNLFPLEEALKDADALILAAAHDEFRELPPAKVAEFMRGNIVIDPVNVLDRASWKKEGFRVLDI